MSTMGNGLKNKLKSIELHQHKSSLQLKSGATQFSIEINCAELYFDESATWLRDP